MSDAFVYRGHDTDELRAAIERWVRAEDPALADVTVTDLVHPSHDGFSNVTLVATLAGTGGPADGTERVAVRLLDENAAYDGMSLRRQFDDQRTLLDAGLPVPEVKWFGTDDDVLGPEFYAMGFVPGAIPSDLPSYHVDGWMLELTDDQRRELWWDALDHVVQLHSIDPVAAGFDRPAPADLIDQMLADRVAMLERFAPEGSLTSVRDGLRWLADHKPTPAGPLRLCWGDARLPNMAFADQRCVAMLDWEDLHLGWPEFDLAWFIYMDAASALQTGVPRLGGLGDADATVERWCAGTGLDAPDLEWATIYGAVELTTGFAHAFASFAPPDQLAETLDSIEQGAIYTDLRDRLA